MEDFVKYKREVKTFELYSPTFSLDIQNYFDSLIVDGFEIIHYNEIWEEKHIIVVCVLGKRNTYKI